MGLVLNRYLRKKVSLHYFDYSADYKKCSRLFPYTYLICCKINHWYFHVIYTNACDKILINSKRAKFSEQVFSYRYSYYTRTSYRKIKIKRWRGSGEIDRITAFASQFMRCGTRSTFVTDVISLWSMYPQLRMNVLRMNGIGKYTRRGGPAAPC